MCADFVELVKIIWTAIGHVAMIIYNFLYSMHVTCTIYTLCHKSYRFNVIYAKDGTIRDA